MRWPPATPQAELFVFLADLRRPTTRRAGDAHGTRRIGDGLAWTISVGWNTSSGATAAHGPRATSSAGPWTQVGVGPVRNGQLQFGATYYYHRQRHDGSSAFSSSVSARHSRTRLGPEFGGDHRGGDLVGQVERGGATRATGAAPAAEQLRVHFSRRWSSVSEATSYTLDQPTSSSGP